MSEARSSAATGCLRARGHCAVHLWTTAVRVRTAAPKSRVLFEAVPRNFGSETHCSFDCNGAAKSESPQKNSSRKRCAIAPFNSRVIVENQALKCGWRPEPESNRRARICSPLRNHSAIGPGGEPRRRRHATPLPRGSRRGQPQADCRLSFDEGRLAFREGADMSGSRRSVRAAQATLNLKCISGI